MPDVYEIALGQKGRVNIQVNGDGDTGAVLQIPDEGGHGLL